MTDLGFIIALIATIIALFGVYEFNQLNDSVSARRTWFWSNCLFVVYFAGRCLSLWDGLLGDLAMLAYFAVMLASNIDGIRKEVKL